MLNYGVKYLKIENGKLCSRSHIHGTAERPRLNVFSTSSHIYVQIIDDDKQVTLTAASSMDKDFKGNGGNIEGAKLVGASIAKKALAAGITEVVLDCDEVYNLHTQVRNLLLAAREGGLKF